MDNDISIEWINKKTLELENSFGVKEPFDNSKIIDCLNHNNVDKAIHLIAEYLGLPIKITIEYVPNDYQSTNIHNQFHSTHLTKFNTNNDSGGGIFAQVGIPSNIPFLFSNEFKNYPITIKINEDCKLHPKTFTTVIAHELTHVFLYSLKHAEKDNEFCTDLTAMILGFNNIFKDGRKLVTKTEKKHDSISNTITTTTWTRTHGYLNDEQFNHAYNQISNILNTKRNHKKQFAKLFKKFNKQLENYQNTIVKISRYKTKLNLDKKPVISFEDASKATMFFQTGYMNKYDDIISQSKNEQKKIQFFLKNFNQYNDFQIKQISAFKNNLRKCLNQINNSNSEISSLLKILRNYVSLFNRIKISILCFFRK